VLLVAICLNIDICCSIINYLVSGRVAQRNREALELDLLLPLAAMKEDTKFLFVVFYLLWDLRIGPLLRGFLP